MAAESPTRQRRPLPVSAAAVLAVVAAGALAAFLVTGSREGFALLIFLLVGFGIAWLIRSQKLARERSVREAAQGRGLAEEVGESADGLRLAFEAARLGVWEWNLASGRVKWSPSLEAIHGLPPGAFAGTFEAYLSDIHPDDRPSVVRSLERSLEQKTDHDTEYRIIWPDGSIHWVQGKGRIVYDSGGNAVGMAGVCMDITERKRAEQKFHLAVEAAPNAMVMVNCEGRIVLVNSQTEKLFGYNRNELIGQRVETLAPARFRVLHQEHRKQYVSDPQARLMGAGRELYGLRKDGTEFPVEIGLNPIRTEEGTFVLSAIADITEHQRLEREVRQLAEIVESSDDAIIREALDGTIMNWNRGAQKTYGFAAGEAIGRPASILSPPGQEHEIPALMERIRRGETIQQHQTKRRRKDGTVIDVSLTISPVRSDTGELVGAAVVSRDITEQVRANERLAQLNADLQRLNANLARSNEDLERFAFVASHDLQEPLQTILSYSELLALKHLGARPESDQYIKYIQQGVERMRTLITDLLEYSRAVYDETESDSVVNMQAVLSEALWNLQSTIRETGANITFCQLPTLIANEYQMMRVFQNLIGNAIKYRHAERSPRIHICAQPQGDEWKFSIEDNGIGIDMAHSDRIFGVFRRLHSQREYPGTGLGLAASKRIVERHGGRVWFESAVGNGATFFFTVPAAKQGAGLGKSVSSEGSLAAGSSEGPGL